MPKIALSHNMRLHQLNNMMYRIKQQERAINQHYYVQHDIM